MNSGVIYSNAAALDGIVDRIEEELGQKITVVATGFNSSAKSVPEFGKTTTTSRPASTTNSNSGIPDIPVFMKR